MHKISKVTLFISAAFLLSLVGSLLWKKAVSQGYFPFSCKEQSSPQTGEGQMRFVWEGTDAPVACEPVVIRIDKYPERECSSSPCPNHTIVIFRGKTSKNGTVILPAWTMNYKTIPLAEAFGKYSSIQFTRKPSIGSAPYPFTDQSIDLAKIVTGMENVNVRRIIDVRESNFELRLNETASLTNPEATRNSHTIQLKEDSASGRLTLETGAYSYPVSATATFSLPFDLTRSTLSVSDIRESVVTFHIHRDLSPSQASSSEILAKEIKRLNEQCHFNISETELRKNMHRFTDSSPDNFVLFPRRSQEEPCRARFYASRIINLEDNLCETFDISLKIGVSYLRKDSCSLLFPSSKKNLPELVRYGHFDE